MTKPRLGQSEMGDATKERSVSLLGATTISPCSDHLQLKTENSSLKIKCLNIQNHKEDMFNWVPVPLLFLALYLTIKN